MKINFLDCTLRDGGYYNSWDFSPELINEYFKAMEAIYADYVEIGFRTLNKKGFKGGCGYSTDNFISSLAIPPGIGLAIMINAGEVVNHHKGVISALEKLFVPASDSQVSLIRIACHFFEVEALMPGISWLKDQGYLVSVNLMQIADRTEDEINHITRLLSDSPLDVFYFADSMGGLSPDQTSKIIRTVRTHWKGELGIHTHDNMNQGVVNTIRAIEDGATWVDGTVTGMGRGPGNAKTEYLIIELDNFRDSLSNPTKLLTLIRKHFNPMKEKYGWGSNPFYYLAGKYGIHPTYVQEMICDSRYDEEDILAAIEHLKNVGGKKFSLINMEAARHFYGEEATGTWMPAETISGRDVLILGAGPGVTIHKQSIECFIESRKPFVIALNTQASVRPELIDLRAACHPVRLLADSIEHAHLPQPLVTPVSQLPESIAAKLKSKQLMNFGLQVKPDVFAFNDNYCILPNSLVIAYALAIATSGKAKQILLAGFDGYGAEDPRTIEMDQLIADYSNAEGALELLAITPTKYKMPSSSVYAL